MAPRSGPSSVAEQLSVLLAPLFGSQVQVNRLERMTGGASRETWSFSAAGRELILRRDPSARPGPRGAMRREADAMRACRRAGLRVPEVLVHDDGTHLGTAGLVMARVTGEALPRNILHDEVYAGARQVLVEQLGAFLAGLHALNPSEIAELRDVDSVAVHWGIYRGLHDHRMTFDQTQRWLLEHRPAPTAPVVVHGDLRLGNVLVDTHGLAAVIDWELVHLGDPLEDLAWLCVKAWRFGGPSEVGGIGTIDELIDAYERSGGRPVDRDALAWWIVAKTLQWGIVCMAQAAAHRSGAVRSVELAAIGRRVAEQEWDLIELLAPDEWAAVRAAPQSQPVPDVPGLHGYPTARELLDAVHGFLLEEAVPGTSGRLSFHARVAANVVAMVGRELAMASNPPDGDDWASLARAGRDKVAVASPKRL
jgi:aminoglycoside phosphotransferase (APT) family kinase protein